MWNEKERRKKRRERRPEQQTREEEWETRRKGASGSSRMGEWRGGTKKRRRGSKEGRMEGRMDGWTKERRQKQKLEKKRAQREADRRRESQDSRSQTEKDATSQQEPDREQQNKGKGREEEEDKIANGANQIPNLRQAWKSEPEQEQHHEGTDKPHYHSPLLVRIGGKQLRYDTIGGGRSRNHPKKSGPKSPELHLAITHKWREKMRVDICTPRPRWRSKQEQITKKTKYGEWI